MSWPSIDDRVPAERAPAARELLEVVLPHRRAALAEAVDVGDAAQVVEAVEARATSAASHTEPSADSPSPSRQ